MFKFTFNLGGSPAANPFAAQAEERERVQQAVAPQTIRRKLPAPPRRPSPPPSIPDNVPRTKKRGWAPTSSSASAAISQPTMTTGWIDTPAKYLAQASLSREEDDMDGDLPPTKKRKTLTDSIISTAFSAALIGTAVGMTAYRMWRDRGKAAGEPAPSHMDAPPPYQREEWAEDMPRVQPAGRTPRPHKPRSVARRVPRHRKAPIAMSPARSPSRVVSPSAFASPKRDEFRDDQGELEDQMDWMGDKIRHLIEEGQKALGKEVVVKMDEQTDEEEGVIDDGMEGWEEDQDSRTAGPSSITSSTRSSSRRKSAKPPAIKTSVSPPTPHSFLAPHSSTATSPRRKRSRYTAGGSHSETSPGLSSPYLGIPNGNKLGGRPSDEEDFRVIYEPGAFSPLHSDERDPSFEDEDSRLLTQGIDAIKKAYRIH